MISTATELQFSIGYCPLCRHDFVRCPRCGNNCCNGGHGEVDGKECDVCPLAYQYQRLYDKLPHAEAVSDGGMP